MKVFFKTNTKIKNPNYEVHVVSDKKTEAIAALVEDIQNLHAGAQILYVKDMQRKTITPVDQNTIISIEVQVDLVTVVTKTKKYVERARLYKVRESLDNETFVQISKSGIVNLRYLDHVAFENDGTTVAILRNQQRMVITRTYFRTFNNQLKEFTHAN